MKLTEEQQKILKAFSFYVQSYGSKKVNSSIYVDDEGEPYWDDFYGWHGDDTKMTIEGYDAIDDLIKEIVEGLDIIGDYFGGSETSGHLVVYIDTIQKTMTFSADVRVTNSDDVGGTLETDEISEQMLNWMREMRETESYETAVIHYQGGGDEGYLESDMEVNGKQNYSYPNFVEGYLVDRVSDYGDWYNNEGGQGDVHINFIKETITIEGGINYEDEEIIKVPVVITF
jgi:hypothetical protein